MNHNSIQKGINKGIIQFGEIDKIIKINSSTKNKPDNITGLYSALTPTESSFAKNKNLVISSNINKIKSSKVHSCKNNNNKNSNNANNDSIKKNLCFKNKKRKGNSSSTNIKSNYNIFKTKNLKSAKSLLNNINHFGNSIKININLPRPNMNNNNYIKKSKSKEKMVSSFLNGKNNIFRKSMSHTRIQFHNSRDKIDEFYKQGLVYVGSEPNLKQKSSNKNNREYKNEIKKEIKKAFNRLLTLNIDFELESLKKMKLSPKNHYLNNSNNKNMDKKNKNQLNKNNNFFYNQNINNEDLSAYSNLISINRNYANSNHYIQKKNNKNGDIIDDISIRKNGIYTSKNKVNDNNKNNSKQKNSSRRKEKNTINDNDNICNIIKYFNINLNNKEYLINNNKLRNTYTTRHSKISNNISQLNLINNINNSIRLNSNSKSKTKTNFHTHAKNKSNIINNNNLINVNKYKENNIKNNNKNNSNFNINDKNNNIFVLYTNRLKNKDKNMSLKSKTSNKNININININDIKTTNINMNEIKIENDIRKKVINNNMNPVSNANNISSSVNNIINYITNINTTNLNSFIKTNNFKNVNCNNQKNKVYKNAKSTKNIINNMLDNKTKKNITNNNYLDILDNNNNLIEYTIQKNYQKQNYFSHDNNSKMSMYNTSNNFNSNNKAFAKNKSKMELMKRKKEKKLTKNLSNNLKCNLSNLIKAGDIIMQQNKKNVKVLSSSSSQRNTLASNKKIKVRRKRQLYANKFFNNNDININLNSNANANIFMNKCLTKFKTNSILVKNIKEKKYKNKNIHKIKEKKYYSKLVKNEPVVPNKIIKYLYKYLKAHEVTELKELHKNNGLVYYTGELVPRIKRNENSHIIIFHSTKNIKKAKNAYDISLKNNETIRCNSCPELSSTKTKEFNIMSDEIESVNPNINNKYNFNDKEGDYLLKRGYHLNYRYEIMELLGKGSFGEAVKCYDHKNKEIVCIKIINSREEFQNQAMVEIKILTSISLNDTNNESGNVKFYHYFNFRGHICLVFELLGKNLYECIQLNNFNGLDLSIIRNYTIDILISLMFLKSLKIIHCDLKPENILVTQDNENKVKIIDFGSSCFQYEITYSYIQSRFYRAPEVILDLGYEYEIDIWSLGCLLCELYTGNPIFPGSNELEQINYIMEYLGPPPTLFVENSPKREFFFDVDNNKSYLQYIDNNNFDINNKKNLIKEYLNNKNNSINSDNNNINQFENFIDFICQCLEWNPNDRLTPEEGLMHPFITSIFDSKQIYRHKLRIKRIKNKTSKEVFTPHEKSKELSLSSNKNNIENNNSNSHKLKISKSFIRTPLNLSIIKNDSNFYNIDIKNEINEIHRMNSNYDLMKKNEKQKNYSINNTHFTIYDNQINNIKNLNLNKQKNNLMNLVASIDINLRKIVKNEKSKRKNNKKNVAHYLPKKKTNGRLKHNNNNNNLKK